MLESFLVMFSMTKWKVLLHTLPLTVVDQDRHRVTINHAALCDGGIREELAVLQEKLAPRAADFLSNRLNDDIHLVTGTQPHTVQDGLAIEARDCHRDAHLSGDDSICDMMGSEICKRTAA